MTDIVKYNNEMNTYPVFKLSEVEQDIFMALLSNTTFNDSQTIEVNLYELKEKSNFWRDSITAYEERIDGLLDKICNPKIRIRSGSKITVFVCFDKLEYDNESHDLKIHVQDDFYQMVKNYKLGFTRFELAEFVNLSGSYAKTLYRLLKQYRTSGSWVVTVEDFKRLLNIPTDYRQCHIDQKVLKPCIKQLSRELDMFDTVRVPFRNLKCEKIKKKGRGVKGRGGTITHYAFTFDAEKRELIEQNLEQPQPQTEEQEIEKTGEVSNQPQQTDTDNELFNMTAGEFAAYYRTAMKDTKTDKSALAYALGARQDQAEIIKICNELALAEKKAQFNNALSASLKTKSKK